MVTPVFTSPTQQRHRVEVLGDSQQIVVNGVHPGTNKPYRWHGGEPGDAAGGLPELTKATAEHHHQGRRDMREHGWTERRSAR
jgi:hypothetical protein